MEKKKLSLLSRFMEVTAKGTKNKQLKEVESGECDGGGGRERRGKRLLPFTLSSVLVDLFPRTCITLAEFFFFF